MRVVRTLVQEAPVLKRALAAWAEEAWRERAQARLELEMVPERRVLGLVSPLQP